MKFEFRTVLLSALILTLTGWIDLNPVQPGKSLPRLAEAAQWSEGILKEAVGLTGNGVRKNENHEVEIMLQDGGIFPMDSEARIKDANGRPITWEKITFPSKIRFRLEKGVVVEMVLIEALPR